MIPAEGRNQHKNKSFFFKKPKMNTGWDQELTRRRKELWCHTCGDHNKNLCNCAKEEWIKNSQSTFGLINPSKNAFKPNPPLSGNTFGACVMCPGCGSNNSMYCKCFK